MKCILTTVTGYFKVGEQAEWCSGHVSRSSFSVIMVIDRTGVHHWLMKNTTNEGVNAEDFIAFLTEAILKLSPTTSGCLVMDNTRIHHSALVLDLLEAYDIEYLFLPPYSPDYNPIELVFGWMKWWIKRIEPHDMFDTIQAATRAINVDIINLFIDHCWRNWTKDQL